MKETKGFFTKMAVLAGVFVGNVALLTRDEIEEFVSVVGRIDEEGVEVESQDERDGALVTSHPLLYSFLGLGLVWSFSPFILPYQFFGIQIFGRFP